MTDTQIIQDKTVEKNADDVLTGIRENYFTAMIGDSDSTHAKSIFERVEAKTEQEQIMGQEGYLWVSINMRPGISPIDNLVTALSQPGVLLKRGEMPPNFKETVNNTLRSGPSGLIRLQQKIQEKYNIPFNLLLLVNQFDDLFDYFPEDKQLHTERYNFILLLLSASVMKKAPVYVGIALKPEHLSDCFQYQGLGKTIRDKSFILQKLDVNDYKIKVECQFANRSEAFKDKVNQEVETLYKSGNLDDFAFKINFLRTALKEIDTSKNLQLSDVEKYASVGGLNGVIDFVAERFFTNLQMQEESDSVQSSQIFKAISQVSHGKAVSAPITFTNLLNIVQNKEEPDITRKLTLLVQKYESAGFLTVMEPSEKIKGLFAFPDKTIILISHAAIFNNWKRALLWTKEESADALNFQRIARQANDIFIQSNNSKILQINEQNSLKIRDIKNGERLFENIKINKYWAQQYSTDSPLSSQRNSFEFIKQYWKKSQEKNRNQKQAIIDKEKKINRLFRWVAIFASLLAIIAVASFFWIRNSSQKLTTEKENLNQQNFLSILSDAQIIDIDFAKRIQIAKDKSIKSLEDVINYITNEKILDAFDMSHKESLTTALLAINNLAQITTDEGLSQTSLNEKIVEQTTKFLEEVEANDNNTNYYPALSAYLKYLRYQVKNSNHNIALQNSGRLLVSVPTVPSQFVCADKFGNILLVNETKSGGIELVDDSKINLNEDITALAISPDGLYLYAGTLSGELFQLNRLDMILNKAEKVKITNISEKIYHIHISASGQLFVATKNKIYQGKGKYLKAHKSGLTEINNLTLSPDERYLVVGGSQKSIFYPLEAGKISRKHPITLRHPKKINKVLDISAANTIAMGTERGNIILFDITEMVKRGKTVNLSELPTQTLMPSEYSPLTSLTFLNQDMQNTLASGTENGKLFLWTKDTPYQRMKVYNYENPVRDIIFNNENVLISMEGNQITAHRTRVEVLAQDIKEIIENLSSGK